MIKNAKRPVILAGHGIIESGAMEQVRTLAERAQIPVATTLLGIGGAFLAVPGAAALQVIVTRLVAPAIRRATGASTAI